MTKQERRVYDSFELAGDIGGLVEILFLIPAPVIWLLLGKGYNFSLMSKLFWVSDMDGSEEGRGGSDHQKGKDQIESIKPFKMDRSVACS